jgi:DNA-binding CsgD family transcriptional regulator
LDHGLGIVATSFVRPPGGGGGPELVLRDVHSRGLAAGSWERFEAARSVLSPEALQAVMPPGGYAGTWTELAKDRPNDCELFLQALGYPDLLGLFAADPNGVGIHISAPLPEATKLSPRLRQCWQMLGAHIATAHRLRHALVEIGRRSQVEPTGLPHDAEAVFDARGFRIVDAVGRAKEASAAVVLRKAARSVDRARGKLRVDDPQRALETWRALVSGRWSMIDWFDTDGRRFVLAVPNPPEVRDPRGLTEQECQVVMYVVLGESSKLIAYRLGLSQARVSALLKSAMYKLGVKNKGALAQKLGPLGVPPAGAEDDDESAP